MEVPKSLKNKLQNNIHTYTSTPKEYQPIKISIIFEGERLQSEILEQFSDINIQENLEQITSQEQPSEKLQEKESKIEIKVQKKGYFGLCQCPGKKLKMGRDGKPRDRSIIEDINYFKKYNEVDIIICLLNDYEVRSLGVDVKKYEQICQKNGIEMIKLPILEMAEPECSLETFNHFIEKNIVQQINNGKNVVAHCRGGIGRAGLLASCSILKLNLRKKSEDAISMVRKLRDKRCVERMPNSGKHQLQLTLKKGSKLENDDLNAIKTIGLDRIEVKAELNLNIIVSKASYSIRNAWPEYSQNTNIIIFMVDISNDSDINNSYIEFQKLIQNPKVGVRPTILLFNKIDLKGLQNDNSSDALQFQETDQQLETLLKERPDILVHYIRKNCCGC